MFTLERAVLNPSSTSSLTGKTIVVTGSSSGIGKAIAIKLASHGASVVIHGRAESDHLFEVRDAIRSLDQTCDVITGDFSTEFDFEKFVDRIWSDQGPIDGWINNAGADVLTGAWAERSLIEKLDLLWKTDVTATWMLSRAIGQRMLSAFGDPVSSANQNGTGCLINMGWDQAWQGMAGDSGELFATTKGAIMSMSKSLAQSLAPVVRVNCLAPGWIRTQWGESASTYWSERAARESLMNRWGSPDDVANVAAFLCSDDASFISGQIIPVNGGFRFGS